MHSIPHSDCCIQVTLKNRAFQQRKLECRRFTSFEEAIAQIEPCLRTMGQHGSPLTSPLKDTVFYVNIRFLPTLRSCCKRRILVYVPLRPSCLKRDPSSLTI